MSFYGPKKDLQQFSKPFSQDELEFCQILNWVTGAYIAWKCYWMKKSFKPVIGPWHYLHKLTSPYSKVCNFYNTKVIGYSGHEAHGMVAKLIQLAKCKFKVSWVKFIGIRLTQIYYQLKKIFEYIKDLFYVSQSRIFLAPAVNFVIFMAQRPSASIALLKGRAKFTRTLSNSPKCWRLPGYEDVVGLKTDSSLWKDRLLVVPSEVY